MLRQLVGRTDGVPLFVEELTKTVLEAGGLQETAEHDTLAGYHPALAFCDADCFPEKGWLSAGVRALEGAELVQGRVLPDPGAEMGPFDRSLWIGKEVGLWETANLFVTRALFDRVGGFEDWPRVAEGKAMAEDVWFGWRAKRSGARSSFCPEALAYHAPATKDPFELAERVRADLGRAICDRFRDEQGRLHAVVLDPRLELDLRRGIQEKTLVFDPGRMERLMVRLALDLGEALRRAEG